MILDIIETILFIIICFYFANDSAKDKKFNSISVPMGFTIAGIAGIIYLFVVIVKYIHINCSKFKLLFCTICILYIANQTNAQELKFTDNVKGRNRIYTVLDTMPAFPGGWSGLAIYLDSAIKVSKSTDETVITSIIIDTLGYASQVSLIKGLSNDSIGNMNIISALSRMPRWSPGIKDGLNVNVMLFYPIKIRTEK